MCGDLLRWMTDHQIDSDFVPDAMLSELKSFLQREGLLEG
jgi:hypothetical protein